MENEIYSTKTWDVRLYRELYKDEKKFARRLFKKRAIFISILVLILSLISYYSIPLGFFAGFISIFVGLIGWQVVSDNLASRIEKMAKIRTVIRGFQDDMLPHTKIKIDVDYSDPMLGNKKTWEGRSAHGNVKVKYKDQWLRVKCTLIDHSILKIKYSLKSKKRKGIVIRERHCLTLNLLPNPNLYNLTPQRVDTGLLKKMAYRKIDNVMEDSDVWTTCTYSATTGLCLNVVQEERFYTDSDIKNLISGLFQHINEHKR